MPDSLRNVQQDLHYPLHMQVLYRITKKLESCTGRSDMVGSDHSGLYILAPKSPQDAVVMQDTLRSAQQDLQYPVYAHCAVWYHKNPESCTGRSDLVESDQSGRDLLIPKSPQDTMAEHA